MAGTRSKDKEMTHEPAETKPKATNTGRQPGVLGWAPWEDRALAKQVQATKPWSTPKGEGGTTAGWDAVATSISSSNKQFKRNGLACQRRFKKLLECHKKQETRDKQATGETGEIDEHVQIMTDVYNRVHDFLAQKKTDNSNARAKILMEKKAGAEYRDACMTGIVPRDTLCDITELEGSTSREKGGQRKGKKRARSASPRADADTEVNPKPDPEPAPKKRRSARQQLVSDFAASRERTFEFIGEVRRTEAERADKLQSTLDTLASAVSALASSYTEDREERRRDHADTMTVIAALAAKH